MRISILIILATGLLLGSCSKDIEPTVPGQAQTKTEEQKPQDPQNEKPEDEDRTDDKPDTNPPVVISEIWVKGKDSLEHSTSLGNLIVQAVKRIHQLDVVLYPSELVSEELVELMTRNPAREQIKKIVDSVAGEAYDEMIIGLMKGKAIEAFIRDRVLTQFKADLQAAGVSYQASMIGGYLDDFKVESKGKALEPDRYYKVALSNKFFKPFPGYFYGNGLNFNFRSLNKVVSAKQAVENFLSNDDVKLELLVQKAVQFTEKVRGEAGDKRIFEIQGRQFLSPVYGFKTQTKGIVTAISKERSAVVFYIQDKEGDGVEETSDAIEVNANHSVLKDIKLAVGDEVSVRGVVYEVFNSEGLSKTSLKKVEKLEVLSKDNALPENQKLGDAGRAIPDQYFSRFKGNLNKKETLDLKDGLDFWESLEGMRVEIQNPRVVGFNGGYQEYYSQESIDTCQTKCDKEAKCIDECKKEKRAKGYLTLYLKADGDKKDNRQASLGGGVLTRILEDDYNPELLIVTTDSYNHSLSSQRHIFNMGDLLQGKLEGILTYQTNTFGEGEYYLSLPTKQDIFDQSKRDEITPLSERPATTLTATEDQVTIASYNIKNLGGDDPKRLGLLSKTISEALKCPDILNLLEVQDNNGASIPGGSKANRTLETVVSKLECPNSDYKILNIDPVNHQEGGEPGGNIRVAMLYNASRVDFKPRSVEGNSDFQTEIKADGNLSQNPGRIEPKNPILKGTRKSLAAQFSFKGKSIYVLGNHFNSKLSDSSHLSAVHPHQSPSNTRRVEIAKIVNGFVKKIQEVDSKALVVALGDFNSLIEEESMQVLKGDELKNLMEELCGPEDRYSTVHEGNSQPLDYIFANKALMKQKPEFEVLHINTDYMGALSDHDPVISRFLF